MHKTFGLLLKSRHSLSVAECRVLLMTIADEIAAPLRSLSEVTWTAKQLYANISGEDL